MRACVRVKGWVRVTVGKNIFPGKPVFPSTFASEKCLLGGGGEGE